MEPFGDRNEIVEVFCFRLFFFHSRVRVSPRILKQPCNSSFRRKPESSKFLILQKSVDSGFRRNDELQGYFSILGLTLAREWKKYE